MGSASFGAVFTAARNSFNETRSSRANADVSLAPAPSRRSASTNAVAASPLDRTASGMASTSALTDSITDMTSFLGLTWVNKKMPTVWESRRPRFQKLSFIFTSGEIVE